MRKFSKTFQNRAARVVAYVDRNPGQTAQEIAYHLNLGVPTVHDILLNDTTANLRTRQGKVAALDYSMKPRWFHYGMPLVKGYKIDVLGDFKDRIDLMTADPTVRSQIAPLLATINKIVQPSKSIRQRKKDGTTFVSGVQLVAAGYQGTVDAVKDIGPRLAQMESQMALLTAGEAVQARYGTSGLRKTNA